MSGFVAALRFLRESARASGEQLSEFFRKQAEKLTGELTFWTIALVSNSKAARSNWPECQGLELVLLSMGAQPHVGVRLRDPACADVFSALAEDVAVRVSQAGSARQAMVEMLGRLRRWQHFLAAANDGLSIQAQRGPWPIPASNNSR